MPEGPTGCRLKFRKPFLKLFLVSHPVGVYNLRAFLTMFGYSLNGRVCAHFQKISPLAIKPQEFLKWATDNEVTLN